MGESIVTDSTLGGGSMATAYSADMRLRVIGRVESGASRREAAEHYEVSPSTAVIWVKCFRETGRCAAKPRGGSTSPLEKHADMLLALIEVEPDLTLDEVICAMREKSDDLPNSPHLKVNDAVELLTGDTKLAPSRRRKLVRARRWATQLFFTPTRCAIAQHWAVASLFSDTLSSALPVSGIVRPRAFAVLRLTISSNFVGWRTGRSAGFSPLSIRPV
jgi:hypothetical protein